MKYLMLFLALFSFTASADDGWWKPIDAGLPELVKADFEITNMSIGGQNIFYLLKGLEKTVLCISEGGVGPGSRSGSRCFVLAK